MITETCHFQVKSYILFKTCHNSFKIASLKATIAGKEQLLQQFAQKYSRATACLEKNLQRAEKEISVLDNVIGEVLIVSYILL